MEYIKRKVVSHIIDYLNYKEAIVIYGARQVGKTTILKILINELKNNGVSANAIFYIDLEDLEILTVCDNGTESLIKYIEARTSYKGKIYLFIDEIQYMKNASGFIKLMVDNYSNRFKLLVSGASVLDIKSKVKQSLIGRIFTFEIFGLDFEEYLWFQGKVFNLKNIGDTKTEKELKELFTEFIYFGSYPRVALIRDIEIKKSYLKELIQTYIKKDIRDIGKIRNIIKFNDFLRILADQAGNLLNVDNLSSSAGIAKETVYDYLTLLEGTYIVRRLSPFFKNIKSELTKMPKIFFEDSGVLNYLQYNDIVKKVSGDLFENTMFTELRKHFGMDALRYWRTQSKKEVDFIVDKKNKIHAFEIKKLYTGQKTTGLEYFHRKYPHSNTFIVTLEKKHKTKKDIPVIYPWEI